jgi:predicted N-acetyltransferase YhbS
LGSEFTYRGYEEGDEEGIVPLLVEAFNGWPKIDCPCSPMDHWKWKYLDNPYGMELSSVALDGDKIIGAGCQYPTRIKIGDEWLMGAYAADLAVHQGYRNRGVSKRLVEQNVVQLLGNKINYVYFVTSNPYLVRSYTEDYPEFPYKIANMVRIRDLGKHLKYLPVKRPYLIKIGYQILKNFNILRKNLSKRHPGITFEFKTETFRSTSPVLGARLDKLLADNSGFKFILDKGGEFLRWRFLDPRSGGYLLISHDGENGSGYVVVAVNRIIRDYPIGYIVDILATPGRTDIVNNLIRKALRFLDGLEINTVSCLITKNHPYEGVLKHHGFLDSRVRLYLFTLFYESESVVAGLSGNYSPREVHFTYAGIDSLPAQTPEYAFN